MQKTTRECKRAKSDGGIHPRGDRKSAQGLENTEDREAPLRKRVRKKKKAKELDKNRQCGKDEDRDKGWPSGDRSDNSRLMIAWKC
jgi:hypothetical protein